MKTQGSTELPRFAVGALAIAGASAANGATVQITFANNYVSSSSGVLNLWADLTGDGVTDVAGLHGSYYAAVILPFWSASLGRAGTSGGGASGNALLMVGGYSTVVPVDGSLSGLTGTGYYGMRFTDSRINAGATTDGKLELTSRRQAGGEYVVQIHRLIFDDASTAAPTGLPTDLNTIPLWSASISAVPEASTSLGLLALGAGGLLTRRRQKRAA
jgi:hypothetical protein